MMASAWAIQPWEVAVVPVALVLGFVAQDVASDRARRNRERRRAALRAAGKGTALDRLDAFLFPRDLT